MIIVWTNTRNKHYGCLTYVYIWNGASIDVSGAMARYIDTGFGHDFHGDWIEAVRLDAGGIRLEAIGFEVPGPAFGHLAATGVAGTKK